MNVEQNGLDLPGPDNVDDDADPFTGIIIITIQMGTYWHHSKEMEINVVAC